MTPKTSAVGQRESGEGLNGSAAEAVARQFLPETDGTTEPRKRTGHRKARGAETQRVVAEYFRANGFPYATDVGAGRPGRDILNVDGVACEVKARRDLNLTAWLRQCAGTCDGDLPVVVHRPDGFGPASVADWPVTMRFADFVALIEPVIVGGARSPRV